MTTMQSQIHAFVETAAETFGVRGPVYEFSYRPDGTADAGPLEPPPVPSDDRSEAPESEVERLEDLQKLPFPDGAARTVVCVDALAHVFEPQRVVDEMIRILAPGGMLMLASSVEPSPTDRADEYWRPTPGAIARVLGGLEATLVGWQGPDPSPHTVFGLGFKGPVPACFFSGANQFLDRFQGQVAEAGRAVGWWSKLRRLVAASAQTQDQRRRSREQHKAQFIVHLPVDRQLAHQLLSGCLPAEQTGTRLDLSQ